ncbi:class I SAM-dependent methyltransferase family protein [Methanococcoides methylutens]|uniref:tRNA(Phe) (4-demethylwyosine(37)-C(7)) aminocarboxypropyltransferase n=1 Tax=Methanococcoides methylutens MM1 TaxID=1434104 RepID=A0A0E3X140_METMT|nr:class I SAM-dependent methyltransferase family protein [Methanococcoides methylutens]AKB84859.1 tRNA methylase Trm12p Wyeosine biosynthesis [Methanococcoides methylutens MM1]
MKAVVIPVRDVEEVKAKLISRDVLDKSRKIRILEHPDGKFAEIPVTACVDGFEIIEQEEPEFYRAAMSLKEHLDGIIPEDMLARVPSGWQVLGDIVIVTIPEELQSYREAIARKLLEINPRCRCVLQDFGIKGTFREPDREVIIGEDTETIQKEHGCSFKLDATKIMYSKGNLAERKRMSKLGSGEVVVDMFAGIGYFSIPLAVHGKPKKVYSIELNPVSYNYLLENIRLNHLEGVVEAINGDCGEVAPQGVADRVIMGYVGTTHHYLDKGIGAIRKEGGMLHYHETTPESLVFDRPIQRIKDAASALGRDAEISGCHRIKKYSPGVWHVVVDAYIK